MARAEAENSGFKEKVKKWGLVAAIGGGVIFVVSGAGLALTAALGGGGAYFGAKALEKRESGR